jgi:hypothetical protein
MINKTLFGLAIAAVMAIAGCGIAGCNIENVSESAEVTYDFSYKVNNGEITITSYGRWGKEDAEKITIPRQIDGIPVTAIGEKVFYQKKLTGVTIPDSVTTIGASAFYNNKLTSVTIPDSVTSIGEWSFSNNQLISATIGNGVTVIGEQAFSNNQLTSVIIGNGVETIGERAFSSNQLTSVIIGNGVETIGNYAFDENPLTSITIGAGVDLGNTAFPGGFVTVYATTNSKAAGTYTRSSSSSSYWTKQ